MDAMKKMSIGIVTLLIAACNRHDGERVPGQGVVECSAAPHDLFPTPEIRERDQWYGAPLRSVEEGPLCAQGTPGEVVYRLTWLPSFHAPAVIRITWDGKTGRITAYEFESVGDSVYSPKPPQIKSIDTSVWRAFDEHLNSLRFWSSETLDTDRHIMGLDGATWILEGVHEGKYRVVERWDPEPPLAALSRLMMTSAGMSTETLELYAY